MVALADPPTAAPASAKPTKLWSRGQPTWIWRAPKKEKYGIGLLRLGQSVKLRKDEPVKGPGCADSFYPVEPFGWVCLDRTATISGDSRWLRAMEMAQPFSGLMPYHYALSNGAPMYRRAPTKAEADKETPLFGKAGSFKPQSYGNKGHEKLAEVKPIPASDPLPWFLQNGGSANDEKSLGLLRREIPHGSMLAYTKSFEHEGRTYVLSSDGTIVPATRIRPFRQSQFKGTELNSKVSLPIAFMREKARPKYRKSASGGVEATGTSWPVRSWVEVDDGASVFEVGGKRYLQTKEREKSGSLYVLEDDATVVRKRDIPIGVTAGSNWIIVSITQGTLVAYENEKPVYATLQSPGAGGVPIPGKDPVKMSTTPMGVYRMTFKHRASTMSPESGEKRKFWIAEVPYTQYFNAPFALHTAYWHEDFGQPMSAGCVNVSPLDGKWLYDWTDPKVPDGWSGAGPGGPNAAGTYVVVYR